MMTPQQQHLVETHMDLIGPIVYSDKTSLLGPLASCEELYGVGSEALCRAAISYDSSRGPFSPFARTVIRNAVAQYCRNLSVRQEHQTSMEPWVENLPTSDRWKDPLADHVYTKDLQSEIHRVQKTAATEIAKGVCAMERKAMGDKREEISRDFGVSPDTLDNWTARAKRSLLREKSIHKLVPGLFRENYSGPICEFKTFGLYPAQKVCS